MDWRHHPCGARSRSVRAEAWKELALQNARKRYAAPVRTLAEAQSFYGMLCTGSEVLSSPLSCSFTSSLRTEGDALLKLSDDAKRARSTTEKTTSHRTSRTKWLDDDEVPARLSERQP